MKCPQCQIERKSLGTPCSICGYVQDKGAPSAISETAEQESPDTIPENKKIIRQEIATLKRTIAKTTDEDQLNVLTDDLDLLELNLENIIDEEENNRELFENRVQEALDWAFSDPEDRALLNVRKPSKKVMAEALKYGDAEGWETDWETGGSTGVEHYDLMDEAIAKVAPDLIKQSRSKKSRASKGKKESGAGCLVPLIIAIIVVCALVATCQN